MNYLKQGGKIGIFFIACAITFGFSNEKAFSAPTTRDDCLTYVSKTAQCKNSCSGLTQIGTCSDDTSGNTLCCDKVYKEGDKCGTGDIGTCREYKGSGKTCTGSEVDIGACSGTTTTGATLRCCSSSDSVSTSDDSCKKVGGVCIPDSGDAGGGCLQDGKTIGTKIGTCNKKAGSDNAQNCCKSSSSTDSSTLSSSGSGASLKYTPLENLPGFENQGGDFATYFGNLYKLALWIVGISALFMLVVGGFLYLSSAGNTALLVTAKKTIYSALIGLVIALVSWLLLDTINSDLTNLKLSGLSGAISSGSSSGTGSAGTGSGGSTATGTYTHAEAAAALSAAGIGITSSSGRIGCSDVGCTTLEGIPKSAIDNLISIKKDCGCSFNVTGGTEAGHASHGSGKPIVDVTQDTTLGNFLYSKAGGSGGATITKSPGYGISKICVTTAWEKLNFGCGSYRESAAHFHLVF